MRTFILASLIVLALVLAGCAGGCPDTLQPVCGEDGVTYRNSCLAEQAGTTVEQSGPCKPEARCTDSDGGKDIFSAGEVEADGKKDSDRCKDSANVVEQYCDKDALAWELLPCPSGYECKAGECAEVPCVDSDGGQKPGVKGTVSSGDENETDVCADEGSVKEYYCDGNRVSSKSMDCPAGQHCAGGRCVEFSCTDSDGGKDTSERGSTSDGTISFDDTCFDDRMVTEFYCGATEIKSEKIACGATKKCQGGKCVDMTCEDSDGGKDKFNKGTTVFGETTHEDSCYSNSQVLEYYCSSDTSIGSERITCGSDHECVDGECKRLECQASDDSFTERDQRFEIAEFDDGDKLRLYEGDSVEIANGMFLKLYSVSGNTSSLRLYDNYDDFKDDDIDCTVSIDAGDLDSDICGENTGDIEVSEVNDGEGYADLYIEEYYVTQYYDEEGLEINWTGSAGCPDDRKVYEEFDAFFYPYMDTESSGLDLDGMEFRLFDTEADIEDIGSDSIRFELDGEDFDLEDNDVFEYDGVDYEIGLTFRDGGIYRILIRED